MEKKHYGAIDGLRAIAAIGIVMMHMGANNNYEIGGYIYNKIIPSFTNFVFLFMVISAFGMCCGYYEKFKAGEVADLEYIALCESIEKREEEAVQCQEEIRKIQEV